MYPIVKTSLFAGLMSTLGLFSYVIAPGYEIEENFGLSLLFKARGVRSAPNNTVIIAIDKIASDFYRLPNNPAKWPRSLHTKLIHYLQSKQVAVIAMDIFFKDAKNTENDQLLANAIKQANNVVLFTHLKRELLNAQGTTPRTISSELINIERLIYPTPVIATAPMALAPFALPKYPAKVSTFWLFRIPAGEIATMPVVTLQLLLLKQESFLKNLNVIENDTAINFPIYGNDINIFIQEMKRWSKRYHPLLVEVINKIKADFYKFSVADKLSLLQFLHLYNSKNIHYLNFFGPARTINTITFDAVLSENLPKNFSFKDKVVFIGFSDQLQPEQIDNFYTVYSQKNGVDLSGVEIAATAFSNLYERNSIKTINYFGYLMLISGFGFLIAFLARYLSSLKAIWVLSLSAIGYFCFSVYVFSVFSLWLPIIIPLFLLIPLTLFFSISWKYIETNAERKLIRKAFGFYLPNDIVNALATKKISVENNQNLMYGTCMATDAEQYTTLSENLKPGDLSDLINNYYAILFKPVRKYKGIISDVVGDAMLAIWTSHIPEIKLKRNACYAAIQIQDTLNKLQEGKNSHALETRIGLHSGDIVMGNVGAVDHFEYRAVGDIVNTANRIQGLNKQLQTRIIASLETIQNISDLYIRGLGKFKLVGKSNILTLVEILGVKSDALKYDELISLFSVALDCFHQADLKKSLQLFKTLCATFPDDGPTKFYIKYLESLLNCDSYVKLKLPGIVILDQK